MEENNMPIRAFPTEKREIGTAFLVLLISVALANVLISGGFYMAFGICAAAMILATTVYLLRSGRTLTLYSGTLLAISIILALSFGRSDDRFIKVILFFFLCLSANLGLCLLSGQNRRDPGGFTSMADAFRGAFLVALGDLVSVFAGLFAAGKSRKSSKTTGAVLLGLILAIPLVVLLVSLLCSADAAFAGLMDLLPAVPIEEAVLSLIVGLLFSTYFYCRAVSLQHGAPAAPVSKRTGGIHPITVNTVLGAACFVYVVYLVSQSAYFIGGFSGILPAEFTMAEYARRGFFEMAGICTVNLLVISLSIGLCRKDPGKTSATRLLCLFIGIITLFLCVTASAKMLLYIRSYGLTRLRVLTELIMVFVAIATTLICIWLFVPRLPYMKAILLTALLMGAVTAWADVDTVVACYNVRSYQSGTLETVDVDYLKTLSDGAVPYLAELTEDPNPAVAAQAKLALRLREQLDGKEDLRSWNIADTIADPITAPYGTETAFDSN